MGETWLSSPGTEGTVMVRPDGDRLVVTSPTMRDHLRTRDAIEDDAQLETNIRVIDRFLIRRGEVEVVAKGQPDVDLCAATSSRWLQRLDP